jgi:hypothetical protein
MIGIQETKELLKLVIGAGNAASKIAADGKVDVADLPYLMALFPLVGPGLEKIDQVPAELKDLDSAEGAELITQMATELMLDNVKTKEIVMAAMKTAMAMYELIKAVKA